ncbi:hypothetical protein ACFRAM_20155 [Paenibacillus sp. NPDC056722]|uniref:hypothetical protein n=1 Tax=Paenibacillus sp. NPDC056722 TaxID=3345924 RepID=UPI003698FCB9
MEWSKYELGMLEHRNGRSMRTRKAGKSEQSKYEHTEGRNIEKFQNVRTRNARTTERSKHEDTETRDIGMVRR